MNRNLKTCDEAGKAKCKGCSKEIDVKIGHYYCPDEACKEENAVYHNHCVQNLKSNYVTYTNKQFLGKRKEQAEK